MRTLNPALSVFGWCVAAVSVLGVFAMVGHSGSKAQSDVEIAAADARARERYNHCIRFEVPIVPKMIVTTDKNRPLAEGTDICDDFGSTAEVKLVKNQEGGVISIVGAIDRIHDYKSYLEEKKKRHGTLDIKGEKRQLNYQTKPNPEESP
jgi:hypothetical protein